MKMQALIFGWGHRLFTQLFSLDRSFLRLVIASLALVISAHLLVQITHQARLQQVRLQTLEGERDALQVEWGRLLLEESALVNPVRLEQLAGEHFQLRLPEASDLTIRVVE